MKKQKNLLFYIHKLLPCLSIACFLLVSVEVRAQSGAAENNSDIAEQSVINDQKNATSIPGIYRTKNHKFYYEQYGSKQYSTIEFKENNRAELRVITDNTNSSLKSDNSDCHVYEAVDYLEYKIVEDDKIELTCLNKKEGWCEKTEKNCFEYILIATITENGIQIHNELFTRE